MFIVSALSNMGA